MTGHGTDIGARLAVMTEILEERRRQDAKWGEQNLPSLSPGIQFDPECMEVYAPPPCAYYGVPPARDARIVVGEAKKLGELSWVDLVLEEFCEAMEAESEAERRAELVQLGALIVAWIECIDRRAQSVQTSAETPQTHPRDAGDSQKSEVR